jgi:DNA-binding transcriptional MerR regulator
VCACEVAVPSSDLWCAGLAEYRLDDLARISGVSSRNIRAYRERGLLDPPRRQGRSAYYDDYHLSQLNTINQLLRKGFNSAHIAEFFARMREGHDLAAILGVQQAFLGGGGDEPRANVDLDLDPECDDAVRLVSCGLAELADDRVVLVDPAMAEIMTRSPDQRHYIKAILRVADSMGVGVDALAATLISALEESLAARYGSDYVPKPSEMDGLIQDYRDLGIAVVTHQLDKALARHTASRGSDHNSGMVASGQWKPADT